MMCDGKIRDFFCEGRIFGNIQLNIKVKLHNIMLFTLLLPQMYKY